MEITCHTSIYVYHKTGTHNKTKSIIMSNYWYMYIHILDGDAILHYKLCFISSFFRQVVEFFMVGYSNDHHAMHIHGQRFRVVGDGLVRFILMFRMFTIASFGSLIYAK